MSDKGKNHATGEITEDDMLILLQRYSATTVLTLLQEIANFPDPKKIGWHELVSKTATGISNAREYQMLWRHIAYRKPLIENLENGAEPEDDDSDIEFELKASPAVSSEAATEAAAYVKVHIDSGTLSHSSLSNSIEGPLTINIPTRPSLRANFENSPGCSMQGMDITIPVFVPKQPLPTAAPSDGSDANGTTPGSYPPRKKRKLWSDAEDAELIAAVHKYGEGNWANILKAEFMGNRTAAQLSQRWAIITKRGKSNVVELKSNIQKVSQAQMNTRIAISAALDGNLRSTSSIGATRLSNVSGNSAFPPAPDVTAQTQYQTQPFTATASRIGMLKSAQKSRLPLKTVPTKPVMNPDSMIKATAVAAGARIATPEDAASHFKAAQAKSALHIAAGGSLIKSSVSGCTSASPSTLLGAHQSPRFVSTGMSAAPLPTYSTALRSDSVKPILPTVQSVNATSSSMDLDLALRQEVKISEERKILNSDKQVQQDSLPKNQLQEDQAVVPTQETTEDDKSIIKNQPAMLGKPSCSLNTEPSDKNRASSVINLAENMNGKKMMDFRDSEDQFKVKECETGCMDEKQNDVVMGAVKKEALNEVIAKTES